MYIHIVGWGVKLSYFGKTQAPKKMTADVYSEFVNIVCIMKGGGTWDWSCAPNPSPYYKSSNGSGLKKRIVKLFL